MPKQEFKETTVIGDKVYFAGEAELSDKEFEQLKVKQETTKSESDAPKEPKPPKK